MRVRTQLLSRFRLVSVVCTLVFGMLATHESPAGAAATRCWSVASEGIVYCNGRVQFDGGGDFAGPANRKRFLTLAKTSPRHFAVSVGLGVLRWPTGDCVYTHGAGGNWMVWCGTRAAMERLASDLYTGDEFDETYEIFCEVRKGQVDVVDVTPLGVAYQNEVCAFAGGRSVDPFLGELAKVWPRRR
jgi:hypothetical protein